jgi:hypothetical protein
LGFWAENPKPSSCDSVLGVFMGMAGGGNGAGMWGVGDDVVVVVVLAIQ